MAHRLPKLQPERSGRRLASQLLDSLTPRLYFEAETTGRNYGRKQKRTFWHNVLAGTNRLPNPTE